MLGLHRGPDAPFTAELVATTGQTSMADLRPPRPLVHPQLTWMDTTTQDMGYLGHMHTLRLDLP